MKNHIKACLSGYRILWIFIITAFLLSSCSVPNQRKMYQYISLQNNAYQLFYQKRYYEAEVAAKEILQFTENEFGPYSFETRSSLINLGNFYLTLGRYSESEPYFIGALEITEQNPFINIQGVGEIPNRDLLLSLSDLADLFLIQDKYTEAEPLYERALKLLMGQPRSLTIWNILEKLHKCYSKTGKADQLERIEDIQKRFRKEPEENN